MPLLHAIVLGIVQGLSEFLPISSSGHLRLVPWLLGWDDFAGRAHLEKTFDVALHLGTLVGAVAYFRNDLVRIVRGGLSTLRPRRRVAEVAGTTTSIGVEVAPGPEAPYGDEGRLFWLLVLSALPAAVLGAVFSDKVDDLARHEWLIGILLVVFGFVLLWADRLGGERAADTFGVGDAVRMGAAQAVALIPGVSRSGATITAGRWVGLDRDAAARLSFLMSLPIIGGALLFEGAKLAKDGMPHGFATAFVVGIVASAITGYGAVWGTLRLLRTRTFTPFVVYRVVIGIGVLVIAASSFR
ncbi:MAG: uppP [Actinomycetia bacterium]|nr:uppP [Actinomycetes bacterium]